MDGSWNADPYATALATRAVATATYSSDQSTPVFIPDEALRRAVNLALGRNAMDNINRGELAQLTSLSAIGAGISDLTGLEWAINLTNANFNNNSLTNITALSGLLQLTSLSWTGNPGNSSGQTQIASSSKTRTQTSIKVPAVPLLGLILMGVTLLTITNYIRRTQSILRKSL